MDEITSYELSEIESLTELEEEEKKRFKVTDIQSANWVFRKMKYIDNKVNESKQLYESELLRLNTWKDKEIKRYAELRKFFEGLITEYILEEKDKDPKFKLSTPYGSAYIKTSPEKWNYDEEELIKWLEKNNSSLIEIQKSVKKRELKEYAAVVKGKAIDINTGEEIQGITITDGERITVIKVD